MFIVGGTVPQSAISASGTPKTQAEIDPEEGAYSQQNFFLAAGQIAAIHTQRSDLQSAQSASNRPGEPSRTAILNAEGCVILPGFVDVHVHGGLGHDAMDGTPDAIGHMSHFHAQHGTTALLPTTMTGPADATLAAVEAVSSFYASQQRQLNDAATSMPETEMPETEMPETELSKTGAQVLGVHLEGPFISPTYPGAQPAAHIRPPSVDEFERLAAAGPVRMMTLAPEQPRALDLIDAAKRHNVVTVMGHTNATYADCMAAADHGLSQATHTYNAMRGLHHREPGALGAVLNDNRIDAQLIADNIHVHPAAMNILLRCKGIERTLLITDAMRAAGLPPGEYTLGGQAVTMKDGECRLADGTLAGSVLTMERALQNFIAATGLSLAQAWPVSSYVPARTLGLHHERGRLAQGYAADLVLLDANLEVAATIVAGRIAFLRDADRLERSTR